jgi:glycolate oxidase subunit GlcD
LASGSATLLELARILGGQNVFEPATGSPYLTDATESRGVAGHADAIVLPGSTEEVAAVLSWCYEHDVPIVPRGGGTGYAAGAVPFGGVVVATDRLTRVRSFDPLLWRICVEAGMRTSELRRIARDGGLLFPPDPGAAEQSHIGGNIATNAGGPHAFKYGVTGGWVTGLEAVIPPGEVVTFGGAVRKDVAGYDLKSLLVGSEGTLGIVTAAWLRLIPTPETTLPVVAFYADAEAGCAALEAVYGNGVSAAALDYLDAGALAASGRAFPGGVPDGSGFVLLAEADGRREEAEHVRDELCDVLAEGALRVASPDVRDLWRWRNGVAFAVASVLGGKVSEDIVVPVDRLAETIRATIEIGARHGFEALSWGHGGDGNLHSTFLLARDDEAARDRAHAATGELFALAIELGGSVSGEHGLGVIKAGRAGWAPEVAALQAAIKRTFDPKGLLNPGKKITV